MDKLIGTVNPVSTDKKIASIKVSVRVQSNADFKVADIQFQEGSGQTQYNRPAFEQYEDETDEVHFNFLARGDTTIVVPYISEIPYTTGGELLPCETDYITTPIKTDLLIHKKFSNSSEDLSIGSGTLGTGKRFDLNSDVSAYTHCIYDGYTSRKYIGGKERKDNVLVGRELRLANADNKYTILQDEKRKSTGVLYAKKTRKEV